VAAQGAATPTPTPLPDALTGMPGTVPDGLTGIGPPPAQMTCGGELGFAPGAAAAGTVAIGSTMHGGPGGMLTGVGTGILTLGPALPPRIVQVEPSQVQV